MTTLTNAGGLESGGGEGRERRTAEAVRWTEERVDDALEWAFAGAEAHFIRLV